MDGVRARFSTFLDENEGRGCVFVRKKKKKNRDGIFAESGWAKLKI